MDFKEEVKAAAEACVEETHSRNTANHLVRQAFFAGVRWYMSYLRGKALEPPTPPSVL